MLPRWASTAPNPGRRGAGAWATLGGMKIYTRTGDKGDTGLSRCARAKRRPARRSLRDDRRNHAAIGVALAHCQVPFVQRVLGDVQSDLFTLGARAVGPQAGTRHAWALGCWLTLTYCDSSKPLMRPSCHYPPLKYFILPVGRPMFHCCILPVRSRDAPSGACFPCRGASRYGQTCWCI